jgi:hypothetical protein
VGAVVVAMGVLGCSSNDSGGGAIADAGEGKVDGSIAPLGDAGAEASADASGVVSGDAATHATACTAGPFVSYSATLTELASNGTSAPLANARIGFSTCAGFELTTSAAGQAITQLTQGIPVTPLYDSPSAISALGAEIPATGDVTTAPTLLANSLTTVVPGFSLDGGEAAIVEIVLAVDAAATAPCTATSGVTLTVTGHTEAIVSYMGGSWPTDTTVASTSASTDGARAFIGGIVGASHVSIAGTKSGCNVVLVSESQTGNFVLLPGSITIGLATVTN